MCLHPVGLKDLRMPVQPADADHHGWQGQDLWVAGNDGRLLHPSGGNSNASGGGCHLERG